ncbi:hypothetical protein Pen02_18940 [Plantactinospora endophytica]|uniref:Uncharacterized protein n=1 Tax=Plantactinospora endophytica TaxID=673535 RepID=A0ABQ4DX06_9ACTN|nr:hypothetical protein Pen02_18940 [Plantactinospora endophytica]
MSSKTLTPPGPPIPASREDPYTRTLDRVEDTVAELVTSLLRARRSRGELRTRSLVSLHNLTREMSGLLNQALGGWPEPSADDDAAHD